MKRLSGWLFDGLDRYLRLSRTVRVTIAIVVFLALFIGLSHQPAILRWPLSCGVGNLFFGLAHSEPRSEPSGAGSLTTRLRRSRHGAGRKDQ
ncbi:hypothetical protein [Streptomyces sp. NPDC058872]|uniref:hypothetical protein n=1 Tax=Streptomyces sp. NPDC058872 TaxID=3346661 RepID=UPI0036BDF05B